MSVELTYALSLLTSFFLACAKSFQTRTIVQGHHKSAFFTSWLITSCEVATVSFVVVGGWWVLLTAGIGGSTGVVVAMKLHEKVFGKRTH